MMVLKHIGVVTRTLVMSVLVLPILFGAALTRREPASTLASSTLASSVARNSVDMTPVGGIKEQARAEAKRLSRRWRRS